MPLHPKTPSSLASFKSRLVFRFWYWLAQVVLEKRLLNALRFRALQCFSNIQIGFTFLVPAHPGSRVKGAVKRVCVLIPFRQNFTELVNHCTRP